MEKTKDTEIPGVKWHFIGAGFEVTPLGGALLIGPRPAHGPGRFAVAKLEPSGRYSWHTCMVERTEAEPGGEEDTLEKAMAAVEAVAFPLLKEADAARPEGAKLFQPAANNKN